MIAPVIIDAGPALNFFATNNERLLLGIIGGSLHAPETVADEVHCKARSDQRFSAAHDVWAKLTRAGRLNLLADDVTTVLSAATQRITGIPLAQRKAQARDLGEVMVVAHAAVLAEAGRDVVVLIDERNGAILATREKVRIDRLRQDNSRYGSMTLASTLGVLEAAIGSRYIPDKVEMRRIYTAIRRCDDGLVDITRTRLLDKHLWQA